MTDARPNGGLTDAGSSNSASSSSRTAREDGERVVTVPHADQSASLSDTKDDTTSTPAINYHGPNNNAETINSMFASHQDPANITKTDGDPRKGQKRTISSVLASSMTSSVNTVPVFARRQHRTYDARTKAAKGEEEGGSAGEKGSEEKKDDESAEDKREAIDRHSIGASTFDDGQSDEGEGPGRYWTFTLRGAKSTLSRPYVGHVFPKDDDEEKDENRQAQVSKTSESKSVKLTTLITNLRAKSDYYDSADDDNVGRPELETHASTYEGDKQMPGANEGARGGWSHDESNTGRDLGAIRTSLDGQSISRNFPKTPGWHSPWRPESPGEHSIRFGKYRFNNFGEGGYFPRSETKRSTAGLDGRKNNKGVRGVAMMDMEWWKDFLLHNTFVPLLFRAINIGFTTCTLAIAIKLWQNLRSEGAEDAVGSSPIVAIVFAPLTLLHVGIQIYLEYFSRPIGIWRVGSKLFYTLVELIFICFWSAELSLAFDNYFTSTLVCSSFNSPYVRQVDNDPAIGGQQLNNPARKPYICRLQGALIGLVFTSLLAYVIVLALSLFRIFIRVSKR